MKTQEEKNISAAQSEENSYELDHEIMDSISDALDRNDDEKLRELVKTMHAADIAEVINVFDYEQRKKFTKAIRKDLNPEVLVDLEPNIKDEVLEYLGPERSANFIAKLDTDDAINFIEDLHKNEQNEILAAIPEKQREVLREGLSYPEDAAGRLMNKKFVAVSENWTVGQTIDYMRSSSGLPDDFYSIFVLDKDMRPVGDVLVSRVMRKKRDVLIKDIMETDTKTINLDTDQEEVAYLFRKYAISSAPVIGKDGKILGIITLDDVINIVQEEAEEDIMHLGGITSIDLHSASLKTAIGRFPWLFINLLTAIAASVIIAIFQDSIEKLVALAVLMPIIASMAGNAGTQTLTIAVRAIATKDLTATNALRIVRKEVAAAIINGLFFAVIVSISSFVLYHNFYLSFVFGVATAVALLFAGLSGVTIPLILARMGVDPAIASGVFLTTITDMSSFFVFLGLATLMLF